MRTVSMFYNFFIIVLFTACFYHFLFWRYLNSSMTSFSSEILPSFPNSNDLNSRSYLVELIPLPYSRGRSTCYSDRLRDFSVTIHRCYKDVYVNNFFPCAAIPWDSLPMECFPLAYDLSGFNMSKINRIFPLFVLFFLVTPYLIVAVQPCME